MTEFRAIPSADRRWDRMGIVLLAGIAVLVALTFRQYGNGFDAQVQDVYGKDILSWFRTDGADHSALSFRDLYYYGGLFDTVAALANQYSPFPHWATRHLLEAACGLLGLAGAWRLGRHLGGARAGVLSLAALALMPSYYGMMFINPKDIPFAAAAIWSTYLTTRIAETLPRPPRRLAILLGVTVGAALGVRIAGVLLLAYVGAVLATDLAIRTTAAGWTWARAGREAAGLGVRVLLPLVLVAWVVMLVCWPWGLVAPIGHPLAALTHFSGLSNGIVTLFFGHQTSETYHPASYLPVYVLIKLPDVVLVLLAAGLTLAVATWRQRGWRLAPPPLRLVPVLLAALFPVAYAVATKPELYDAERHFLFVLPPLAVLTGLAADRILALAAGRRLALAACTILLAAGAFRQVQATAALHPYEYAFYNDLVGGPRGAHGQFDMEYWGTSLAEATQNLRQYLIAHHLTRSQPWRVAICGEATQMGDAPHPLLRAEPEWNQADFFIATPRQGCDHWLAGKVIATVSRDGVPFAIIKDLRGVQQAGRTNGKSHGKG